MTGKETRQKLTVLIQEIEAKKSELDNLLSAARQSNEQTTNALNDVKNKLSEIIIVESQINQKLQIIEQSHSIVVQKEEEIKSKLEAILQIHSEAENKKSEIEKLKSETKAAFEKINDFYQKQEERYLAFYKQIEEELKAGTTSVNLSKSFADKVGEYHKNSRLWSWYFIALLIVLIIYYGIITFSINEVKTLQDVWRHLGFRFPFLVFGIWLAIFFGNRRAESKKLEELYKHKEAMARSFVGYKKTLEELGDEDKVLLKQHMENLLKAMSENSASFLNSEGDKHPFFELISYFLKSKSKKEVDKE